MPGKVESCYLKICFLCSEKNIHLSAEALLQYFSWSAARVLAMGFK